MIATDDRLQAVENRISLATTFLTSQARIYRRAHFWLNGAQIVSATSVPVLAFALPTSYQQVGAALAGALAAIAKALDGLFKSRENWIRNITTREQIMSEHCSFRARSRGYAKMQDPVATLSDRVEAILANERDTWAKTERTAEQSTH